MSTRIYSLLFFFPFPFLFSCSSSLFPSSSPLPLLLLLPDSTHSLEPAISPLLHAKYAKGQDRAREEKIDKNPSLLYAAWSRLGCVGDGEASNTRVDVPCCVRRVRRIRREWRVHAYHPSTSTYTLSSPLSYTLYSIIYTLYFIPSIYSTSSLSLSISLSLSPPLSSIAIYLNISHLPPLLLISIHGFSPSEPLHITAIAPSLLPHLSSAITPRSSRRFSHGGRPSSI